MNVLAIVTATLKKKKNFSTLSQGLHGKRFFLSRSLVYFTSIQI